MEAEFAAPSVPDGSVTNMICYRDRTYCRTWKCGDEDCPRRVTDAVKAAAAKMGLGIAMRDGCYAEDKKDGEHAKD